MSTIIDGSAGITFPSGTNPQAAPSKVLQVVQFIYNTDTSTSSTSFVDTGTAATITPLFSTSKIMVIYTTPSRKSTTSTEGISIQLVRNSTALITLINYLAWNNTSNYGQESFSAVYLDSPATTSATTYKTQFKTISGTACSLNHDSSYSTITLMEIAQ